MKISSFFVLGLALSSPLLLTAPLTHAGDCMEVAVQLRHNLQDTIEAMKGQSGYIDRSAQNMGGYAEHSHLYSISHEIESLTMLIELYHNAFEEDCIGQVKDMYDTLTKRAKRKNNSKRKAFDAPATCEALMERIDQGRTGEFCPNSRIADYNINQIRKTIELENRRRKK